MNPTAKVAGVVAGLIVTAILLGGCNPFSTPADTVSDNLSKEADQFRVPRRVVFYNGITDSYMLTIEGYCSLGNHDGPGELTVTCQIKPGEYKKHFLGLSDNVTYFVEQLEARNVSAEHYKVIFRPTTIVPDIDIP